MNPNRNLTSRYMDNERYIAAIEISSSKIIAAVGKVTQSSMAIVAVEQIKGPECVRFGIIQNAEETASRIVNVLDRLENRPEIHPRHITKTFVSIAGRSMRSIPAEVELNLPEESEITDDDLQRLKQQAMLSAIDNSLKVIDVVPRIYKVNNTETQTPKGTFGSKLGAIYDLIVCRPVLEKNLHRTVIDKLGLEVPSMIVTPLAASHVLVSPEEKRLGCMMVDMGAETTTVLIFKGGNVQHFSTLPLGSRNITRDLISLSILEERADEIKQRAGDAMASETHSHLSVDGIPQQKISDLVVARAEEIAANICEQIYIAGYKYSDLPGGIIAIGGGFKLKGMVDLVNKVCNMSVRLGKLPAQITIEDTKAPESDILQIASVMYTAATHSDIECLVRPERSELPAIGENDEPEEDNNPIRHEREAQPGQIGPRSSISRWAARLKEMFTYGSGEDGEDDEIE